MHYHQKPNPSNESVPLNNRLSCIGTVRTHADKCLNRPEDTVVLLIVPQTFILSLNALKNNFLAVAEIFSNVIVKIRVKIHNICHIENL
jgi:hypothetical protein